MLKPKNYSPFYKPFSLAGFCFQMETESGSQKVLTSPPVSIIISSTNRLGRIVSRDISFPESRRWCKGGNGSFAEWAAEGALKDFSSMPRRSSTVTGKDACLCVAEWAIFSSIWVAPQRLFTGFCPRKNTGVLSGGDKSFFVWFKLLPFGKPNAIRRLS